ncbi:MAG: MBL fold metallo-hydrolase [Dehalococcoidia bacterium]|nr:MBL fold metallo-hydrolase [Dehalococcoidia bacterium]
MLIDKPGQIAEGLYLLGETMCMMYLIKGKDSMIVGGGMNWLAPSLEKQLNEMGASNNGIQYLVVMHPHFDHCGAVPYLKRKYPGMKVLAAKASQKLFSKQKIIDYMEAVNLFMIDYHGIRDQYEKMNLKIDSITIDETVDDSTVINLGGGVKVEFIETAGHSAGDISVYIPGLKAIFPSDAAPAPLGSVDKLTIPSPQYDFALYKESLKKLIKYDVEICGFEHMAALVGPDAQKVLLNSLKRAEDWGQMIVEMYKKEMDFEKTFKWVVRERLSIDKFSFLNEDVMYQVARAEVRNILRESDIVVN